VQSLALKAPGQAAVHVESALAVARAALDAQEFTVARNAIRPLLKEPTQRVATLMAEIEQRESGDEGRAREWMGRALRAARDPQWSADGFVSDRWMPVSPVSGRLDAFQWKVPLAELGDAREIIDLDELDADKPPVIVTPAPPPPELPVHAEAPAASLAEPGPPEPRSPSALAGSLPKPPKIASRPETIIPLLHVPDDPGPEAAADMDPEPEPPAESRGLRFLK
jgi:HemY protein